MTVHEAESFLVAMCCKAATDALRLGGWRRDWSTQGWRVLGCAEALWEVVGAMDNDGLHEIYGRWESLEMAAFKEATR